MKNALQHEADEARRQALERLEKPDFDHKQGLAGEDRPPLEKALNPQKAARKALIAFACGAIVLLALIFLGLSVPSDKTCRQCGRDIDSGSYCSVCGAVCRRCGQTITTQTGLGYCLDCYGIVYEEQNMRD